MGDSTARNCTWRIDKRDSSMQLVKIVKLFLCVFLLVRKCFFPFDIFVTTCTSKSVVVETFNLIYLIIPENIC